MPAAQTKKAPSNGKPTAAQVARAAKTKERPADVAAREAAGEPQIAVFRGLRLQCPAQLPATFALDMAELQGQLETNLGPTYNLIVSIIGPEQWRLVRAKVAEDTTGANAEDAASVLGDLLAAVFGAYGMDPGESAASADSSPSDGT